MSRECETSLCEASKARNENNFFDPSLSSTYQDLGMTAEIWFGSGKLAGHFGTDDFIVGQG